MSEERWRKQLRLIAVVLTVVGGVRLGDAVTLLTADRTLPTFAEAQYPQGAVGRIATITQQFVFGLLYVAGGVAVLRNSDVARRVWLTVAVLGPLWFIVVEVAKWPQPIWLSAIPCCLWFFFSAALFSIFARKDWRAVPTVATVLTAESGKMD